MNIEIFLPGLNEPVLVSEDKFRVVMDIVGKKFYLSKTNKAIYFNFGGAQSLARYILGYFGKRQVDHINHNQFDNTNENLRIATKSQNNANRRKKSNTSSKYKGVSWKAYRDYWEVCIKVKGQYIYLGHFKDEIEAAKAYNVAALKYFGEFALLNVIPE